MKGDPLPGRSSVISAYISYKMTSGPSGNSGHALVVTIKDLI